MTLRVPPFSQARVLVFGDLMLDRYWHGPTSRISPEAPVPVVKVEDIEDRAGGAGNVALNIAALTSSVDLIGLIGQDEAGRVLENTLTESGVDCSLTKLESHPTITKLRILSRHQQLIRLDFEEGFQNADFSPLHNDYQSKLDQAGAVILSDYGKGALEEIAPLIAQAKDTNTPVLVDPKGSDFERYRGATLITPNLSEFEAVVGPTTDEADLIEKGQNLIEQFDLEALLVTRSEKGMTLLQRGEPPFHLAAQAREVYDVTGAGDTVISVLGTAIAAGASLKEATALANVAAGLVVAKLGTATVSLTELKREVRKDIQAHFGILNEDALQEAIQDARDNGESIVMTNGCFDILHPGHVAYLKQAKALGDRLIVAVNTDQSVSRLKGPERPINPVSHRMDVLAGLESVDWVVPFAEDTPQRLIAKTLPDLLVKGGDYHPKDIAGYDEVTANGGEVLVLDFQEGCSTSNIIDNILNRTEER